MRVALVLAGAFIGPIAWAGLGIAGGVTLALAAWYWWLTVPLWLLYEWLAYRHDWPRYLTAPLPLKRKRNVR